MVCLHQSDFRAVDGFSKTIKGWGREDVDFYERIIKSHTVEVRIRELKALCHSLISFLPISLPFLA